jgi:xanthosine utilization system XapX-like protein
VRASAHRPASTLAFLAAGASLRAISPYALMVMLPALILAWVVLIGWFTGERAIALVRRVVRRKPTRRPATQRPGSVGRARSVHASGGLLLACSLASRPPPRRARGV